MITVLSRRPIIQRANTPPMPSSTQAIIRRSAPRLLRLARRDGDRAHAVSWPCRSRSSMVSLHMRRRRPVIARECLRHRELLGLVHVPVLAGRIERMMRIGERHRQEERRVGIGVLQIGLRAFAEKFVEYSSSGMRCDRPAAPRIRAAGCSSVPSRSFALGSRSAASGRNRRRASPWPHDLDMIIAVERRLNAAPAQPNSRASPDRRSGR